MALSLKQQREKMWNKNPHCENCGILTILPQHVPGIRFKPNGQYYLKVVPPNMATIQHKYDRLHPERLKTNRERKHFLWCYNCNHDHYKNIEEKRSKIHSQNLLK